MKRELNEPVKVVVTGGLGEIIAKKTDMVDFIDRRLTLDGLKIIYQMNKD